MKNKLPAIFLLFGILFLSFLFYSSSNNPPNGKTGAPGEGTCADCHSANAGGYNGSLFIEGIPPMIIGGATYQVTVTAAYSTGSPVRTGFQMVCLNSSNSNAGVFSNPSPTTTITSSGGRVYFEHNAVQTWGGNTMKSWTVDWTAPSGPNGDLITFYAASVIANGNSGTSGDDVLTTSAITILNVAVDPLVVTLTNSEGVSCFGASDGTAEVNVTGGQPPYSYLWSNSETGNPAVNLPGGTNSVTVSDGAGAMETLDVFIDEPSQLVINSADITNTTCPESQDGAIMIEVSGGTMPYSYSWSNGALSKDISDLESGSYTVTITDANDCVWIESFTVNSDNSSPDVSIFTSGSLCAGSTIVLSTNGTFELYQWSTGESTPEITIDQPGFYEVTVYDINGCVGYAFIDIEENPPPLAVIVEMDNNFCQQTGSATLSSQFETNSYLWSTGETTSAISVTMSGTYSLTITDAFGCTASDTYLFEIPANLLSNLSFENESAPGASDGTAQVDPSGGVQPYAVSWSNGSSGLQIENLPTGNYSVTVTDANGCIVSESFFIASGECDISASYEVTNPSCFGFNDGLITIFPVNAEEPIEYSWSVDVTSTSPELGDVAAGEYSVTITDSRNCVFIITGIMVTEPDELTLQLDITNETVKDADDGTALAIVTGGTPPYSYSWSNAESTMLVQDLAPGDYSVTVTDAQGCITIEFFTIEASDISSISDSDNQKELLVYPNPNAGKVIIETENIGDYEIVITDMLGRKTKLELNGNELDLSMFGNGNYLLILKNKINNATILRRIVVLK
jgi:hypothetical protein